MVTLTISCKKSDDVAPATTATTIDLKSVMPAGSWSVSSLRQKTEDKSSNFKNMTFAFSSDGSVTVTDGNKTTKGSWVYSPAVTYYGGDGFASLVLNMGTSKPFDLLNRTWNVNTESTTSTLKLDNKEPLDDEHLVFAKNL
ncbi:hypothetical protein GO730_30260 [Spirosoma sp. HMF3257]|uniref:Lipocalin-like domain-containing protein n=1 Tax=Spirosoma telluris TaxID=2183553 RepID=A0A327NSD5_9BACT|nr:hypothetical protein [Spirosoma telluris]RAI77369.1 hypothetical protein HMF3257_30165 [Spirosoma telluris]